MSESELEEFIKKASSIAFHCGSYSTFFDEIPGNIDLVFKHDDAMDCIRFSEYIRTEYKNYKIKIYIKQVKPDNIDFTLLIEREPAIILTVKDIKCRQDKVDLFFKKQPKDKIIYLNTHINHRPDTLENMALIAEASLKAESYKPIPIQAWDGSQFVQ